MLYILGGASRSGKSMVARRFVSEKQIPFFCIDFLITPLQEIPSLNIKHGQPFISKAEKLWPLVKPLLIHLIKAEPNYLIEGDGILPNQVAELLKGFSSDIKACFVGFSEINPQDKFKQVRKLDGDGNKDDWTKNISDEKLMSYIKNMVKFSKYLKSECNKYDISYFDSSNNFSECLESVFQYLANQVRKSSHYINIGPNSSSVSKKNVLSAL